TASLLEALAGAGPELHQLGLARERARSPRARGLGLPQLRPPGVQIALPGLAGHRDPLLLARDLRLQHRNLAGLGLQACHDVRVVEAGEHRAGRKRIAFVERDLDDPSGDLGADDALLAFDEAGEERLAAAAMCEPSGE